MARRDPVTGKFMPGGRDPQRERLRHTGLTPDAAAFIARWKGDPDACQICGGSDRRLVWDHDWKTGIVRGRVCDTCNQLLGKAKDDPRILAAAIAYLDNPPALAAPGWNEVRVPRYRRSV